MKARIINHVEETPNIFEFDGMELDLQFGMYSLVRVEEKFKNGISEMLLKLKNKEHAFFILSTLINEAIIIKNHKEKTKMELVTPDYVMACMKPQDFPKVTRVISRAMGLSFGEPDEEQAAIDREIDEALNGEDIEDSSKNLKAEN